MANIFRAPLYVPSPPTDMPWVGRPVAVPLALLTALIPTFFLQGTRQANAVPDPVWTVESQPSPLTLTLPPAVAAPFSNSRQFYFVPEPVWTGEPAPTPLLLELAAIPFSVRGNRHFDVVPEPGWLIDSAPVPLVLTLPPAVTLPFANPRTFNFSPEPVWVGDSIPTSLLLELAVPPFTVRGTLQFNYVPEPGWVNDSVPPNLLLYTTPVTVLPFSNPRNLIPVPQPDWVFGGGAVPETVLQLPALPPFTARGSQKFDMVPEPVWTDVSQPVNLPLDLPPVIPPPSSNPRNFNVAQDIGWVGTPRPSSLLLNLVAAPPFFTRTQHFDLVEQPGWVGDSTPPSLLLELAVVPATVKATRHFDHSPEPYWLGAPRSVPITILPPPALLMLPFSNPRHFDNVPMPLWSQQGPPVPLVLLPPPLPPSSGAGPAWRRLWNQYVLSQGHPQAGLDEERDKERILRTLQDIFGKDFLGEPAAPAEADIDDMDEDDEEVIALWLSL